MLVEVGVYQRRWVTLTANFRWKKTSPPTTVGLRKLECFTTLQWSRMILSSLVLVQYHHVADRPMDGFAVSNMHLIALCAVASKNLDVHPRFPFFLPSFAGGSPTDSGETQSLTIKWFWCILRWMSLAIGDSSFEEVNRRQHREKQNNLNADVANFWKQYNDLNTPIVRFRSQLQVTRLSHKVDHNYWTLDTQPEF